MKTIRHLVTLAAALMLPLSAEPVSILFDTDIGNDVDDVLALGMIHSLETRGACKFLAVTVTKDHSKAAPFVDVVNTFYGRGDIPIGMVREGPTRDQGKFNGLADDAASYPHDLKSGADAPDALPLLRRTLAAQPDASVVMVQVGFFTNFSRLLDTPADEHSPLNGRDLIKQKVKLLSLMAGSFKPIGNKKRYLEYNVEKDVPAAQKLAREWPTPMWWSGFEIGIAATYPHQSIERDFNYVPHHPLKAAYYAYNPPPHDRPTWDLTSVLVAVLSDRGYFKLSPKGRVEVADDGFTQFTADADGPSQFLEMDELQRERVREACVQLSSQPPAQ